MGRPDVYQWLAGVGSHPLADLAPIPKAREVSQYQWILNHIERSFFSGGQDQPHGSVRIVGLLFARPSAPSAKDEINPNLPYWHARTGKNINIYCAGFFESWNPGEAAGGDLLAAFDNRHFNELREEIEQRCKWRYSGSVDLILLNATRQLNRTELDFSGAIAVQPYEDES